MLQGADVKGNTLSCRAPLHHAADGDQPAVIKYLIGKGADVNVSKPG